MSMQTEYGPGTKSATAARRSGVDTIAIVKEVMDDNPTASVDKICDLVWQRASADKRELKAFVLYTARNHFNQLFKEERTPIRSAKSNRVTASDASTSATRETYRAKAKREQMTRILEIMTPIGKKLGDVTGKEGRKLGGAFIQTFKDVGDNERLRQSKKGIAAAEKFFG